MKALDRIGFGPVGKPAEGLGGFGWGAPLLGLLLVIAGYAAFAGGAIEISAGSRVQVAVALTIPMAVAGLSLGLLRAPRSAPLWAGAGALAAFGLWSALSISWSVLPDGSWIAANRAVAYAAVVAVTLVAARSARGAPILVALGLTALALAVSLYALGGKLFPAVDLGPVSLDPGNTFARLREPLDYWNALALACVIACPVPIWLAAARDAAPRYRLLAAVGLTLLVLTAALSYSRGALLSYTVAVAVMVGAGPRRLTRLGVSLLAVAAAGPSMLLAFTRNDLSGSEVPLAERADGGLLLAGVLLVSLAALWLGGRELIGLEKRTRWDGSRSRRVWVAIAVGCVILLAAGTVRLATSDRGFSGEISHRVEEFKQPGTTLSNEPERLISANGSSRYVWWEEALGAWDDRPLSGWGAGSFPTVHYLYRRYEAPVRSSHSLPLMLASETGVVGLALGLGGLALLGSVALGQIRTARGAERSAHLALAAGAAAWFAHSLVDWHWEIPGVTLPALIALATAAAPRPELGRPRERPGALRSSLATGAAVLAAAGLAASAALPSLADDARVRALELAAGGSRAEAAEEAARARDLNPLALEPIFAAAGISLSRGRDRESLRLLAEAADAQPENWRPHRRLILTATLLGRSGGTPDLWRAWAAADPLLFSRSPDESAARMFATLHPPAGSPTAFGTPPSR